MKSGAGLEAGTKGDHENRSGWGRDFLASEGGPQGRAPGLGPQLPPPPPRFSAVKQGRGLQPTQPGGARDQSPAAATTLGFPRTLALDPALSSPPVPCPFSSQGFPKSWPLHFGLPHLLLPHTITSSALLPDPAAPASSTLAPCCSPPPRRWPAVTHLPLPQSSHLLPPQAENRKRKSGHWQIRLHGANQANAKDLGALCPVH